MGLCAAAGLWHWYSGRPKPPKPWNRKAITAEYDFARPEGDKNYISFHYMLQNNTDFDYRLDSDTEIEITGRLKQEKGFSQFAGHYVTIEYPVFVPARNRVWIALSVPYPYSVREPENATADERKQYTTDVAKYIAQELSNLDGFVLFDTLRRYEIDFPSGWEERAKQSAVTTAR